MSCNKLSALAVLTLISVGLSGGAVLADEHELCPGISPDDPELTGLNLIVGTPGDDTIVGTSGGDLIVGLGSNDTFHTPVALTSAATSGQNDQRRHTSGRSAARYGAAMGRLDVIGERDGWRCWLCDEAVDPDMSVNDGRGPSIDSLITDRRAKKKGAGPPVERLAHRGCNTGKGKVKPVVPWAEHLFVVDPAVILTSVDRLARKGGREVMARCPDRADADQAAAWLVDRISRLEPDLSVTARVEPGGGQFLLVLEA